MYYTYCTLFLPRYNYQPKLIVLTGIENLHYNLTNDKSLYVPNPLFLRHTCATHDDIFHPSCRTFDTGLQPYYGYGQQVKRPGKPESGNNDCRLYQLWDVNYRFSYALYLRLRHGFKAHVAWFTLTIYGICMILAGVFQDTPGGNNAPLNPEGIIYNAAIITSCISILIGMWMFAGSVYKKASWFGFTWFTIAASFLGLVLSIVFAVQSYVPASGLL
jgi:hypothetical protein